MHRPKKPRKSVPPPIEPGAYYDAHDLRLLLPWLGHETLRDAKRSGALRYIEAPNGRHKHLCKGAWVIDWLEKRHEHGAAGDEQARHRAESMPTARRSFHDLDSTRDRILQPETVG